MAYRDSALRCPGCGVELRRRQRRDVWRCARCGGVHLSEAELGRWLRLVGREVALELEGALRGAARRGTRALEEDELERRRGDRVECATCSREMRLLNVLGAPVSHCEASSELWLPAPSMELLLAWAERRQRAHRSWIARLRSFLFAS